MVCFHAAPAQGQVWPYPQQPVKIRNYRAVASHNQTAISYLYLLRKLVTFSGLPHFKNDSQFVVTQTHHPIPALAHKECGEKASRDGQVVQDGLGAGGPALKDRSSPGPSWQVGRSLLLQPPFAQIGMWPPRLPLVHGHVDRSVVLLQRVSSPFLASFLLHTTRMKFRKGHLSPTMKMSKRRKLSLSDHIKLTF